MKWDCGPSWEERRRALSKWHNYFVWWPIMIGSHDCRWLETIERKGKYYSNYGGTGFDWIYRSKSS